MTRIHFNGGQPVPRYQNHLYPARQLALGDYFIAYPRPKQSIQGLRVAVTVATNSALGAAPGWFTLRQEKDASGQVVGLRCTCVPRATWRPKIPMAKPRAPRCKCPKCSRTFYCPHCEKDHR